MAKSAFVCMQLHTCRFAVWAGAMIMAWVVFSLIGVFCGRRLAPIVSIANEVWVAEIPIRQPSERAL